MSDDNNLGEAMKPVLGMIGGAIATNIALISILKNAKIATTADIHKRLEAASRELGFTDPKLISGLETYLTAMREAAKEGDDEQSNSNS